MTGQPTEPPEQAMPQVGDVLTGPTAQTNGNPDVLKPSEIFTLSSDRLYKSSHFHTVTSENVLKTNPPCRHIAVIEDSSVENSTLSSKISSIENSQLLISRRRSPKHEAKFSEYFNEQEDTRSANRGQVLSLSLAQKDVISVHPRRIRRRIRAGWPHAMHVGDVLNKKGAWERALGYAKKINELAEFDCGLGDWVVLMKERCES